MYMYLWILCKIWIDFQTVHLQSNYWKILYLFQNKLCNYIVSIKNMKDLLQNRVCKQKFAMWSLISTWNRDILLINIVLNVGMECSKWSNSSPILYSQAFIIGKKYYLIQIHWRTQNIRIKQLIKGVWRNWN